MSAADNRGDGYEPVRSGPAAASSLLTPQETALALIDHQGLMLMGAGSHDRQRLVNNVTGLDLLLATRMRCSGAPAEHVNGAVQFVPLPGTV